MTLGGPGGIEWDIHANGFDIVRNLSGMLDAARTKLLEDLRDRGLLGRTLIVEMGEFGRAPKINASNSRDRYPLARTAALAGGGLLGRQPDLVCAPTSVRLFALKDLPTSRLRVAGRARNCRGSSRRPPRNPEPTASS